MDLRSSYQSRSSTQLPFYQIHLAGPENSPARVGRSRSQSQHAGKGTGQLQKAAYWPENLQKLGATERRDNEIRADEKGARPAKRPLGNTGRSVGQYCGYNRKPPLKQLL